MRESPEVSGRERVAQRSAGERESPEVSGREIVSQRSAGDRESPRGQWVRESPRGQRVRESPRGQQAGERAPEVSTQGKGNPRGQWAWAPDLCWWDVSGQERANSSPHLQQTECLRPSVSDRETLLITILS